MVRIKHVACALLTGCLTAIASREIVIAADTAPGTSNPAPSKSPTNSKNGSSARVPVVTEREIRKEFERIKAERQYFETVGHYIRVTASTDAEAQALIDEIRAGAAFDDVTKRFPTFAPNKNDSISVGQFGYSMNDPLPPRGVRRITSFLEVGETTDRPFWDGSYYVVHVDRRVAGNSVDEKSYAVMRWDILQSLSAERVSIVDFVSRPSVKVKVKLQDDDILGLEFRYEPRSGSRRLHVEIPVGTYFKSVAPGIDAMVAEHRTLDVKDHGMSDIYPQAIRIIVGAGPRVRGYRVKPTNP